MASDLPTSFSDILSASSKLDACVNLIGLVTDVLPTTKTRGTDWMCTFSVADQTFGGPGDAGGEGLKVRFFRPNQDELPVIGGIGDVVILRAMKIKIWSGMTMALSSVSSSWNVFSASQIPDSPSADLRGIKFTKDRRAQESTLAEKKYVVQVCNAFDRASSTKQSINQSSSSMHDAQAVASLPKQVAKRDKFSLVKDLMISTYYDLVAQVVKLHPTMDRVDLYVTDYTPNQLLFFYEWGQDDNGAADGGEGDEYNYLSRSLRNTKEWPGPFGKLTLPVTLWPPHSYVAQQSVKPGQFVFLRNVHIRHDQDSKMVGSLHSDRRYPDRVDVNVLTQYHDDDRVKDVLRRKRDYEKKFHDESDKFVVEARESKKGDLPKEKPLSKSQARKKRKLDKIMAEKNAEGANRDELNRKRTRVDEFENKENGPQATDDLPKPRALELNTNIHCANHLVPITPLPSILSLDNHINKTPTGNEYTLPFQNLKYRTTARVIDYYPHDLADFAVPIRTQSEYAVLSDCSDSDSEGSLRSHDDEIQKWKWRFALILSDATSNTSSKGETPASLRAYVSGPDAECLLKLDAMDLRRSPEALANLREKLFLLWGNLEERKAKERDEEAQLADPEPGALAEITNNAMKNRDGQVQEKGRPFQCCLKEYGIKVRHEGENGKEGEGGQSAKGEAQAERKNNDVYASKEWEWERKWRMFGCTII